MFLKYETSLFALNDVCWGASECELFSPLPLSARLPDDAGGSEDHPRLGGHWGMGT